MSERTPDIVPGKPGFWIGAKGELRGMVVTASSAHVQRIVWKLERVDFGKWKLETWLEEDGVETVMVAPTVQFQADTWEAAQVEAKAVLRARKQAPNNLKGPFHELSASERERLTDGWEIASKFMWPNLFALPKNEASRQKIAEAIQADLLGMGFSEIVTLKVAKLAAKRNSRPVDEFNIWLIENWFHGEKLSSLTPRERHKRAKLKGFSCSEKSLGMRLTRLALTTR